MTAAHGRGAIEVGALDVVALRRAEFPWAERGEQVYLNNASTGPLPVRTVAAGERFTRLRAEPWRLSHEEQFGAVTRTRELVARLIGASVAEVALMVNTTYGLNLAAAALPLAAGETVVGLAGEFPANVYPWMAIERTRGVRFRMLPLAGGLPDDAAIERALDEPGVRALAVSWVSFATGYRLDIERLGRLCRERGIWFVVDAMQGLGALELDVHALDVDVLACGMQKWLLSPWGTGFVYVRDALVRQLEPASVGWMSVRGSDDFSRLVDYDFTYRDDARRFEVVTLPFQDFAAANASLELLLALGPARVAARVRALADRIVASASGRQDVELVTPADPSRRAGIVSLRVSDAAAASARLTQAGVSHSLREGAIRLSPHCYNTELEVDRALELLVERQLVTRTSA